MNHEDTKKSEGKGKPHARLFVLLARDARVGVILRKGPTKWVQMIKWHTDTDTFEAGQWIKARIYEHKCAVSPNGHLFIYFALKGRNWLQNPEISMTWTAISKPPYFTALALWPEAGTWGGGGYFIDNETVRIYVPANSAHPDHQPSGIRVIGTDDNIDPAMLIDYKGVQWVNVQQGRDVKEQYAGALDLYEPLEWGSGDGWMTKLDPPHVLRKQIGDYIIEKHYYGYRIKLGPIYKYKLVSVSNNLIHELKGATWADFDQQGRLVLAREGKLFCAALQDGELIYTELADFNANKPEPIEAPEWAQKW